MTAQISLEDTISIHHFANESLPSGKKKFRKDVIKRVSEVHEEIGQNWFLGGYINNHLRKVADNGLKFVKEKYQLFMWGLFMLHDWKEDHGNYTHSPLLTTYPDNFGVKGLVALVRLIDKGEVQAYLDQSSEKYRSIEDRYVGHKHRKERIKEDKYEFYVLELMGEYVGEKEYFPKVDVGISLEKKLASLFLVATKIVDMDANMDKGKYVPDEERLRERYEQEKPKNMSFRRFKKQETNKFLKNKFRNCLRVQNLFEELFEYMINHEDFDEVFYENEFSYFVNDSLNYARKYFSENKNRFKKVYIF